VDSILDAVHPRSIGGGWDEISPGTYVSLGKGRPLMLIVCSGGLTGFREADVLGFVNLLLEADVEVTLHVADDKSHLTILPGLLELDDESAVPIAGFLTTCLP
jgi:hypothetical protein